MGFRVTLIGLPLAAALAGCGATEPGVYDLPALTVVERLTTGDMADFRRARACGLPIEIAVHQDRDGAVRWTAVSDGAEVATFAARLTSLGPDRTKVAIEVPADPEGGEIYDGSKFYKRPAFYQPLRPALEELVAARLEQRPFDVWRIPEDVRAKDAVCSVQRGAAETGKVSFRANGRDEGNARWHDAQRLSDDYKPPIEPGKPMARARPSR